MGVTFSSVVRPSTGLNIAQPSTGPYVIGSFAPGAPTSPFTSPGGVTGSIAQSGVTFAPGAPTSPWSSTGGITGSIAQPPPKRGSGAFLSALGAGTALGTALLPGPGSAAGAIIGAGIGAVASLFGAKKSSDAAKDSSRIQASTADKALAAAKEARDQERAEIERTRAARKDIFARWDETRFAPTTKGNLPNPYGMSDEQTAQMRQGNRAQGAMPPPPPGGPPPSGQAGTMPPPPPGGVSASLGQAGPPMPPPNAFGQTAPFQGAPTPYQNATPAAPAGATMSPPGGVTGSANASTVWLQAPTGETMEIPIEPRSRVQKMVNMGAMIIAKPAGAFGQRGVSYGMV